MNHEIITGILGLITIMFMITSPLVMITFNRMNKTLESVEKSQHHNNLVIQKTVDKVNEIIKRSNSHNRSVKKTSYLVSDCVIALRNMGQKIDVKDISDHSDNIEMLTTSVVTTPNSNEE